MKNRVRVRFAPSPTGFLHLGNIRAALMNFLFAKQRNGDFILRIEDTDVERNIDESALAIMKDLEWLGLNYNEGPNVSGNYGPYIQSERKSLYEKNLQDLIDMNKVYRCFCTPDQLEKMRKEQLAKGLPPRYNRTCLHLSDEQIKSKIEAGEPFIWRLKLNDDQVFTIKDMSRGEVKFEMKHFSDFALTRSDGSFTFMFTNFVDDWMMKISHVIRGEDHLSNTGMQASLFDALAVELPTFWHLSTICNADGKRLSKRDFGFSLDDLKKDGFLPQAICNYLAIIGYTFENEIQSLEELSHNFDFDHMHSTGSIKYDLEKLSWINHKWIMRLENKNLIPLVMPFFESIKVHEEISEEKLIFLINKIKGDIKTLKDIPEVLKFCFVDFKIDRNKIEKKFGKEKSDIIFSLIKENLKNLDQRDLFLSNLKNQSKENNLKLSETFGAIRYLLTGKFSGIGMHDLLEMLSEEQIKERLK